MPLKIPGQWAMINNKFINATPTIRAGKISNVDFFKNDILVLQKMKFAGGSWSVDRAGYCVDLSWLPAGDPGGKYSLKLLKGSKDNVVVEYLSKSRDKVRMVIEKLCESVDRGLTEQQIKELIERIY